MFTRKTRPRSILNFDEKYIREVLSESVEFHFNEDCGVGDQKPLSIFLFGSVARKSQHAGSDVDLLVIWRYNMPTMETVSSIKKDLERIFRSKVDLINMVYKRKLQDYTQIGDTDFLDNIFPEVVPVYGNNDKQNIRLSRLIN